MAFIVSTFVLLVVLYSIFFKIPNRVSDKREGIDLKLVKWKVLGGLILAFLWGWLSFTVTVEAGEAKVARLFGAPQRAPYEEPGLHFPRNPFLGFTTYDVKLRTLDFNSQGSAETFEDNVYSLSSDKLPMSSDVTFGYTMNPRWLWWIMTNIGDPDQRLLIPSARSAIRTAFAGYTADQAALEERQAFEADLQSAFEETVVETLVSKGLTPEEAREVVIFAPVRLRMVLQPAEVLAANTAAAAADRQIAVEQRLTEAMTARQERMRAAGTTYVNFIRAIRGLGADEPVEITTQEAVDIVRALALETSVSNDQVRALALRDAVASGQVKLFVVNGDTNAALSLPQN